MPALNDLLDQGLVRLIDIAIVSKAADGAVSILETQELGPEVAEAFLQLTGEASGLLSEADLQELGEDLDPGTTAAALLFEHVWATRFAIAVRAAKGELVLAERIPHAVMTRRRPRSSPPPAEEGSPPCSDPDADAPSLIGRAAQTAARTAVIAGTATAVSGKVAGPPGRRAPTPAPAPPAARGRAPARRRRPDRRGHRPAAAARRTAQRRRPHRRGVRDPEGAHPRLTHAAARSA